VSQHFRNRIFQLLTTADHHPLIHMPLPATQNPALLPILRRVPPPKTLAATGAPPLPAIVDDHCLDINPVLGKRSQFLEIHLETGIAADTNNFLAAPS